MFSPAPTTRLSLDDAERLVLIKLCVLHGPAHSIRKTRLVFWANIGELATEQLGKPVKHRYGIMRPMMNA
jgi:hypothetical protein